ncbi:MAG: hypothetical protein RL172_3361 [Bacteroidota bacterium]
MFNIQTIQQQHFEVWKLTDLTTGSFASIIPACGAILHQFGIVQNNLPINLVDNYQNQQQFNEQVAQLGFKSCKLSPFACRINKAIYQFEGQSYRADKFLLGDNALHGLLYDARFEVLQHQANEQGATLTLRHQYRAALPGYPFNFDCVVTYLLQPNNQLLITTTITNQHTGNIPVQDGWHPYFSFGKPVDELVLTLKSSQQVVFNEQIIPTGKMQPFNDFYTGKLLGATKFDDCFVLDMAAGAPLCSIADNEAGIAIDIQPGSAYPYLQLYTPPHRMSIAVENLSAPPDCFNNGIHLLVLAPGEQASFSTQFGIRLL